MPDRDKLTPPSLQGIASGIVQILTDHILRLKG